MATEHEDTKAVTKRSLDDLNLPSDLVDTARMLHASGFWKDTKDVAQTFVKVSAGRELGFGPVASMNGIDVLDIGGKVQIRLRSNLMAGLVKRSGRYNYRVLTLTPEECTIVFLENGQECGRTTYTLEDANRAGITGKDVWKHYPREMLYARAMSLGVRTHCPDVLHGPVAVSDEVIPEIGMDVKEVEIAPERSELQSAWGNYWKAAKDHGLTREDIHAYHKLNDSAGAFRDYVRSTAGANNRSVEQQLSHELDRLEAIRTWKGLAPDEPEQGQLVE